MKHDKPADASMVTIDDETNYDDDDDAYYLN